MPLIGTAGHVDHGKSTLIERLTGRDPDRWVEEKRRGLTIDLGFAWTKLESGTEVSFVDVPGHERYLKNMLAGIEAIDIALFVVAADEGWMPQSEEHLAVLDLLGVTSGVVALTKSDNVDEDLLELANAEVSERLIGSSLADIAIIAVSGTTGDGIPALLEALDELATGARPRNVGRPRLWVDRSFSATGAGTVVTGTLLDGDLKVEDTVEIFATGKRGRVRAIQSHENQITEVEPGRRVALNLGGVDRKEIARGNMIGYPGHWDTSSRFLARTRSARYIEELNRRGDFHIHIGSSATPAEILSIDEGMAVIRTRQPIPVAVGDRFVLRDTGRKLVTAGGVVIDPQPGSTRAAFAFGRSFDPARPRDDMARSLLEIRGLESAERLAAHTLGGIPKGARRVGDGYVSDEKFGRLAESAAKEVVAEHERHPLRAGMPLATLAERLGASQDLVEMVIDETPTIERVGPDVTVTGRTVEVSTAQRAVWERVRGDLERDLAVPDEKSLGLDLEMIHLLVRRGELVRMAPNLVVLPEQVEQIKEILRSLPGEFTVADFRDAAGLSRKYAVPYLEWTDKEGLTVRRGDTRTLR
jgi:selenocysteine-specific elongation factor